MASLGEQLKQARERRGVGLDDIAQTTKIGTRFLRALEANNYDQLPGGIFNKGFIRAYARAVGLDEEQAIADYIAATEPTVAKVESSPPAQPRTVDPWAERERADPVDLPWGLFALILLVAALGVASWGFYSRQFHKTAKPPAVVASAENSAPVTTQPAAAENARTDTGSNSASSPPVASQPVAPATAATQPGTGNKPPEPAKQPETSIGESSEIAAAPQYFSVRVSVREDSWLSISADGKMILQGRFVAPAVKAVKARNQVIVQTQNAGGLDFEFNGRSLRPQGKPDEVKTLIFGAEGLEAVQATTQPESTQ